LCRALREGEGKAVTAEKNSKATGETTPAAVENGSNSGAAEDPVVTEVRSRITDAKALATRDYVVPALGFLLGAILALGGQNLAMAIGLGYTTASRLPLYGSVVIALSLLTSGVIIALRWLRLAALERDLQLALMRTSLRRGAELAENESRLYFEKLVEINVTNLAEYYGMVKDHAQNSFLAAMAAGVVGLALVVIGLVLGFGTADRARDLTYVSTGAGLLTEFISGVFFYLYSKTVAQLKDYHDSLIDVQNILLSFKIIGDTCDEPSRAKLLERLLDHLNSSPSASPATASASSAAKK
jgi:hypothetical protein